MTSTETSSPSIRRWSHAFGGVLRLTWGSQATVRNGLATVVLIGALGLLTHLVAADPRPEVFRELIVTDFLMAIVPVLAFMAGAGAVRDDLKPGAVDYVMTRPLPRWLYVVMKYLSQVSLGLILAFIALAVMVTVGRLDGAIMPPIGQLGVALGGGVLAFVALGFMSGALTSRYMIFGLLYAGLVEAAVGQIPIQLNRLSILRHLRSILQDGPGVDASAAVGAVGWLVMIAFTLVAIAAAIFARKEFIGEKGAEA